MVLRRRTLLLLSSLVKRALFFDELRQKTVLDARRESGVCEYPVMMPVSLVINRSQVVNEC
jgi:hypothetical protein